MRGRLAVVLGHARARGGGGRRIGREHGRRRPAALGNEAPAASGVIEILSYKF